MKPQTRLRTSLTVWCIFKPRPSYKSTPFPSSLKPNFSSKRKSRSWHRDCLEMSWKMNVSSPNLIVTCITPGKILSKLPFGQHAERDIRQEATDSCIREATGDHARRLREDTDGPKRSDGQRQSHMHRDGSARSVTGIISKYKQDSTYWTRQLLRSRWL